MKEITTITTLEFTNIVLVDDEELDDALAANDSPEARKLVADSLKQRLGLDKVDIKKVKSFVADV